MFCPHCGWQNRNTSKFCAHCGKPLTAPPPTAPPSSAPPISPASNLQGKLPSSFSPTAFFQSQASSDYYAPSSTPAPQPQQQNVGRWEYKEIVFPPNPKETIQDIARKERQKFYVGLGSGVSVSSALSDIWVTLEQHVREAVKADIEQGWEPDPNGWGASCIEYQTRKVGMSHWGGWHWIVYIFLSSASYGFGFLILPFLMRYEILEPLRIKVRLRRMTY